MKKKSFYVLFLLMLMPILMGSICNGGGGTPSTPTTASVNLSVKYPVGYSNIQCTSRLVWSFTPGSLTGSEGQSNPFTIDHNYNSTSNAQNTCYFSDMATGLKAGTWTVQVTNGATWLTSCVQTLANGGNNLKFTVGRVGCTTGLSPYPGD